jgi:antitoxin PrlF
MVEARVGGKGQITIPKRVRDRLHVKPGDRVEFVVHPNGRAPLIPAIMTLAKLKASIPLRAKMLTIEGVDRVIAEKALERSDRS